MNRTFRGLSLLFSLKILAWVYEHLFAADPGEIFSVYAAGACIAGKHAEVNLPGELILLGKSIAIRDGSNCRCEECTRIRESLRKAGALE